MACRKCIVLALLAVATARDARPHDEAPDQRREHDEAPDQRREEAPDQRREDEHASNANSMTDEADTSRVQASWKDNLSEEQLKAFEESKATLEKHAQHEYKYAKDDGKKELQERHDEFVRKQANLKQEYKEVAEKDALRHQTEDQAAPAEGADEPPVMLFAYDETPSEGSFKGKFTESQRSQMQKRLAYLKKENNIQMGYAKEYGSRAAAGQQKDYEQKVAGVVARFKAAAMAQEEQEAAASGPSEPAHLRRRAEKRTAEPAAEQPARRRTEKRTAEAAAAQPARHQAEKRTAEPAAAQPAVASGPPAVALAAVTFAPLVAGSMGAALAGLLVSLVMSHRSRPPVVLREPLLVM